MKEEIVDLRAYFHKIRTIEATIPGEDAVVVSLETPDGGRAGQLSEVTRSIAAKLVVQEKARLANEEETQSYKDTVRVAKEAADALAARDRVQLSVWNEQDLDLLRSVLRKDQ